ncbi:MAG: hypothetical protein KDC85_21050 [Saprospiraceae bacterium]|nr:hypothetical protein [Saprospiraceae bacterium]MCB9324183.1 hypothetical protein [Lewinellaceae bacterium]
MQEIKDTQPKKGFTEFIGIFPEIELPVSLTEEARHLFSLKNKPIPDELIDSFILPHDDEPVDEFTEFMACFRIPGTGAFHALVYWRAGLLNYQFHLITFDKKGEFIDKRVIAGTYSDGETVTQSIATIGDNLKIIIASGQSAVSEDLFEAATSTTYILEILLDGGIRNA